LGSPHTPAATVDIYRRASYIIAAPAVAAGLMGLVMLASAGGGTACGGRRRGASRPSRTQLSRARRLHTVKGVQTDGTFVG
jgi:hypothetical protein